MNNLGMKLEQVSVVSVLSSLYGAVTVENNGYLQTKEQRAQHLLRDLLRANAAE